LALIALLHVVPAGRPLSPVSVPISNYAQTRDGWLFIVAVVLLALGMAALACALVIGGWIALRSTPSTVLITCCVGLLVVASFPDRRLAGAFRADASVHWLAAMTTFAGMSMIPALLAPWWRTQTHCRRLRVATHWLSVSAAFWFTILFVGSLVAFSTSLPVWPVGGAVERALGTTDLLIVLTIAKLVHQHVHGAVGGEVAASATTIEGHPDNARWNDQAGRRPDLRYFS
jgi:hypothetical protein